MDEMCARRGKNNLHGNGISIIHAKIAFNLRGNFTCSYENICLLENQNYMYNKVTLIFFSNRKLPHINFISLDSDLGLATFFRSLKFNDKYAVKTL
jgi:hypothetical protein